VFKSMKGTLIMSLAVLALTAPLAACGGSDDKSDVQAAQKEQAELYAIDQIEVKWHRASSTKDVDLMMSLWADDATFTIGPEILKGKSQIRDFFEHDAGPFQPQNTWVSDTPAYKVRATVDGDKGTLYFECHYVDVKTGKIVAVVSADQDVEKVGGQWVITNLAAATPVLQP
jgi:ketosteroid isomerase-like protein